MRFMIPATRALTPDAVEQLQKAYDVRGPKAGHRYLKRERAFVGGKMVWRYFYADEAQRARGEAAQAVEKKDPLLTPHEVEAEHHVAAKLKELYAHLAAGLPTASEATVGKFVQSMFEGLSVTQSADFLRDHVVPYLNAEKRGEDTGRTAPMARLLKAAEMIPEHLKVLVKPGNSKGPGFTSLTLRDATDKEAGEGVAGWCRRTTGEMHLLDVQTFDQPYGQYKYGTFSGATTCEEVYWHEFAHQVHYVYESDNPALIKEWQAINQGGGTKITTYAANNWKEDFAESFACAIAYPKQLAIECPERYEFLRKHVLPQLKPISAIADEPDENLAWWQGDQNSAASKLLKAARKLERAPRFHPYYSDRDQFFMVNVGGRNVYMRIGPADKPAEESWEPIPHTIDAATGLPRFEYGLGAYFRSQENLKEVYDENGLPLTNRQAFLYLAQGDLEGVGKTLEKTAAALGDKADADGYGAFLKDADADTHTLTRKLFDSLGGNQKSTIDDERARVAKAREKGKDPVLDRHEWAPVEIPHEEFYKKSGTFKYGNVSSAPAEKQPWHAKEKDTNGKYVTRTMVDVATGKQTPVLTARRYQQENPDGTIFSVDVNESMPFRAGDMIQVPWSPPTRRVERDGVKYVEEIPHEELTAVQKAEKEAGWARFEVKPGQEDIYQLARDLRTSAKKLLQKNGRYEFGQVMNPILAALLNPGGQTIRSEADMRRIMAQAATTDPPPRTWVSIRASGDLDAGIMHMPVEFDGSGPPRIPSSYWQQKLGVTELRTEHLLDDNDKIKVNIPRIIERAPKKEKPRFGRYVWITDPATKKRVMGTYVHNKEVEVDGQKVTQYAVQPFAGQGAGVSKKLVTVDSIEGVRSDEIPGMPGRSRRLVEPLKEHLLLFLDEIRTGSGPWETTGKIRLQLPKDRSITWAQLQNLPGIQLEGEIVQSPGGEETFLVRGATVSGNQLDEFREALGGFVMDQRVQQYLEEKNETARQLVEKNKRDILTDKDFVDASGNINPEGILKGLTIGRDGIQPGKHRIDAMKKLAANDGRLLAAHFMGTGKSALAIMCAQMMRNAKDPDNPSQPHPNQIKKKALFVVPLNTAQNWFQEFKKFTSGPPTLLGAGTLASAQQCFKTKEVPRKPNETDESYRGRFCAAWKTACETDASLWNPWADSNDNCVIPFEYFRDHEDSLRNTGLFDGMVVDEAHKIMNDNEVSRAVERWSPNMNMFLVMTGTPVTDTLDVLPRLVSVVTAGKVSLGTAEEFSKEYLLPSAMLRAMGKKNPPRTDLNPRKVGKLAAVLQPMVHVAQTSDVQGAAMPAVLLDENTPAHLRSGGMQDQLYRAAMQQLTSDERAMLEQSGAMGIDETAILGEEARRKIATARSLANSLGYKPPDAREDITYMIEVFNKKTGKTTTQEVPFLLPDYKKLTAKQPKGWGGTWPSWEWVEKGWIEQGEMMALEQYFSHAYGSSFAALQGQPIDQGMLDALKAKGSWVSPSGIEWPGKLKNPDYGPEGVICRGDIANDGTVQGLRGRYFDSVTGKEEEVSVPVGKRFVRDPNRKAAAVYYEDDDWNYTGRFSDDGEGGGGGGGLEGDEEEGEEEEDTGSTKEKPKRRANEQKPKEGRAELVVGTHPSKRKARAQMDLSLTSGNAKTDQLEDIMKNVLKPQRGSGADEQMILFGNRVGSSVRCMESKLRTLGYMDVNEALGHADVSSDADKERALTTRKFFVTYMGKGATLGDRDINSEIFRRQQNEFGKDTGVSMFVWRSLYGGKRPPKDGEMLEGWSRAERKRIAQSFAGKDGKGLAVPMRVMGVSEGGKLVQKFVYERDVKPKVLAQVKQIEIRKRSAKGEQYAALEREEKELLKPFMVDRLPLTPEQQGIFNSCQCMVASDAANVGLNWPSNHLIMYDSLFSPMQEQQRITRAARMLPAVINEDMKPLMDAVGAEIKKMEAQNGFKEYDDIPATMLIVQDAMSKLAPELQNKFKDLPGASPDQVLEMYFAQRAFDKIATMRAPTEERLKREGAIPDPDKPGGRGTSNYILPQAVTGWDVMNEIIRKNLTPFDREVLKTRRYLVDVKRLTVSADVPEMVKVDSVDPETGKKKKVAVPTGRFITESPVMAERAQLAQGRAKMVPYEYMMHIVQNAQPRPTSYEYMDGSSKDVAAFGALPKDAPPAAVKKSLFYVRVSA